MKIAKSELIDMFKTGRSIDDINAFITTLQALPEEEPTVSNNNDDTTENHDDTNENHEDDNKNKQLEEELAASKAALEKAQADLAAAQSANLKKDFSGSKTDPLDAVRELARKA